MHTTIWVCASIEAAEARRKLLRCTRNEQHIRIIYPGAMLAGFSADVIILDEWEPGLTTSTTINKAEHDWYMIALRTKMKPGAKLYRLEAIGTQDFDTMVNS